MTYKTGTQRRIARSTRFVLAAALFAAATGIAFAQTTPASPSDIQAKIDSNNAQINQLNTEIAQYQTELDAASKKSQTLQNTISQLNTSIKKTTASINLTKTQINTTQLQIQQLSDGIASDQSSIADEQRGLAQALRELDEAEVQPLSITLLSSNGLSDAWQDVHDIETLNAAVGVDIQNLSAHKQSLNDKKTAQEQKNAQLKAQQQTLLTQQGSLSATKNAQSQLLAQTKSQEATYQSIIAQKKAQQQELQEELTNLKAQYNQAVNPNQILAPTPGILQWPIYGTLRITQYFGNTPFANAHEALYSGNGHNGLDIAAPIGTPVHAALSGTILATGNTDLVKGCYSFGKWVMIEHNNGLNTMYAHLSQISVTQGQQVSTGDVIGFSGETGYATGPHLHFGVYVSSVTQIIQLGQATKGTAPCSKATMPVPPVSGYLNPLNYLPATNFIDDTQ
ncbi:MAG TPA: peptidoglycan DD-metalloendopeptidase family protein [Candidatus Paceibacterota bacterium]|nr:peptidoglycan DD-metalloendopeptidase family protein [Candidatus Paceibacterota bacterium]